MVDLSAGDVLYLSEQELFLVVIREEDDSYRFAVHGWRNIGKDRVDQYVRNNHLQPYSEELHHQREVERLVEDAEEGEAERQFNKLMQLFSVYEQADIPEHGPHVDFAMNQPDTEEK